MDNLETAESIKNMVHNAGKMFFVTPGVSPKNNDKENSEIFDDPMMCDADDSAIHNDDNARNDDNNLSITDELVSEEIPPKYDTLSCSEISSAFESPKCKKRKIPRFDELLEKLHFNALFMNFTKFLHFLESAKKELTFAFIEKENEEFFEMIVQDINILKSKILDADYRDICDKIILAASPYLLTCAYEYKQEFHNIVMVIKKQRHIVMDWSDDGTSPVSCSKQSEMQSYPRSSEVDSHGVQSRALSPGPVPSSFVINCLRTTLAFVKNDSTNTKEFPELNSEQARFTQLLLESIIAFTKFDNNLEIKELYRALWEAVRIYSLKYEFKITCEETTRDKKSLMFEKVPKNKTPVTTVGANQIKNPSVSELPKLEAAKPEAAKPEDANPVSANPESAEPELSNSSPVFTIPVISSLIPRKEVMFEKVPKNKPPVNENQIMNPAVSEPPSVEASKPEAAKPEAAKPEAAKRKAAKPKALKPEAAKPDVTNPESAEPELSNARPVFAIPVIPNLIPELSYIKTHLNALKVPIPELAQRKRKKKKVNLQNALQVAEADNIKLETVINLNQSFRSKKKNKKQKKAKLKASKEATVKPATLARPNYNWADASSSTSSSRGTSRDRSKVAAEAKTLSNEMSQSSKNTLKEPRRSPARRAGETIRKEQLMEAMSVPVQSDKAMRMMRGMGWCGGALGTRGDGITEPLMPVLDIARGAGFGHGSSSQFGTKSTKPRKSKTAASKHSDETGKTATDVITQKTKQLLLDNPTVEPHTPKESNVDVPISKVELQKAIKTAVDLANVEPQKHGIERTEFMKMHRRVRLEVLRTIYELLTSDATLKTLKYDQKVSYRERKFLKMAPAELKSGHNNAIFHEEEQTICKEIKDLFQKLPEVVIEAYVAFDAKEIEVKKTLLTEVEIPKQDLSLVTHLSREANKTIPLEDKIHSYIISSGTKISSPKAYGALKFKLIFLTNIFNFVQSSDEELEIDFHKLLSETQKIYIQNVIDGVNMRITFGSSPGEIDLCEGIKNHLSGDEILGAMLNHQFTSVTLNKYYVFNRPPVKSKSRGTVNLISDRFSKRKLNTNESILTENNNINAENNRQQTAEITKVAENSNAYAAYKNNAVASLPVVAEANKSDHNANIEDHSDDKNNKLCTEPKVPPGEEGINISKFTNLHDEEKTNTAAIKDNNHISNNSASKSNSNVTVNKNTNNVGNGNVVIDNNDNQVIDMKRGGNNNNTNEATNTVDTKMAEYVMCVDYTEEGVNRQEKTVDISNEKEINITENKKDGQENDPPNEHSDVIEDKDVEKEEKDVEVKDEVEIENQHKEIGFDIEKMIDEVLPNTNVPIDQNVIVIEDVDTNVYIDTKNEIQNDHNLNDKEIEDDIDVIMCEIDDEPMEVISITKVIDEKKSVELIDQGESLKDIDVGEMEEENGIKPSDDKIVKLDIEMKTDGDIISSEKIVLSEDICDNHSVGLSHVKTIDTKTDFQISKDTEIKTVRIVHTNHPIEELTYENIKEIQRHISNSIMTSTQLPLLKCHGVQDGALIYSCHNKNTYDWLQNIISVASYVKVLDTEITKMALKLYSFFDFYTKDLFKMIELYNQGLSTKDWVVEKTEKDGDKVVFIVSMDKFSVNYIQKSNLALFAGIDRVQFSLLWE